MFLYIQILAVLPALHPLSYIYSAIPSLLSNEMTLLPHYPMDSLFLNNSFLYFFLPFLPYMPCLCIGSPDHCVLLTVYQSSLYFSLSLLSLLQVPLLICPILLTILFSLNTVPLCLINIQILLSSIYMLCPLPISYFFAQV